MRSRPLFTSLLFSCALIITGCGSSASTATSTSSATGSGLAASAAQSAASTADSDTAAANSSDSSPARASGPLTAITIGVSPSTASAAAYLATQQEFAAQGLSVTMSTIQSGAEAIPRLLNGELAFALGDAAGTITAASNGVEVVASGVATVSPSDPNNDYSSIIASAANITGPADLAGHTVAVNQLNGIAELTAKAAIDNQGGDSSSVEFVELAFPQMVEAVTAGRVDAALVVEPFLAGAVAGGLHVVLAPQAYAVAGLPSTIFVAARSYAQEHPDIVARFDAAMSAAASRANADAALTRTTAASYTKIAPEVLNVIKLPIFAEKAADVQGLQNLLDLMNKYEMLDTQPDMSALLFNASS